MKISFNLVPIMNSTKTPVVDASAVHPATTTVGDPELVRRFVGGDEAAFVEIMKRYEGKILAVARSLLHNQADAEEITQDTFVRAYCNLARFRGDSSLATWLHRIAVNLSRNRYWYFFRRRRHATLSFDCPIGENGDSTLADIFSSEAPNPVQESSREEFSALVASCMEKLNAPQREILVLRNLQNLSYDEIARQLGINQGTVKSRIARAREHLRARLIEICPEFAANANPSEWFEPSRAPAPMTLAWL